MGRRIGQGAVVKMICEQGEIVCIDFEPHVGHEPAKYRPALVVSSSAFNLRSSMTVVCPITSLDNGYPMHAKIECGENSGFACVEQMRAADLGARRCKSVGFVLAEQMGEVLSLVGAVFDI